MEGGRAFNLTTVGVVITLEELLFNGDDGLSFRLFHLQYSNFRPNGLFCILPNRTVSAPQSPHGALAQT